MDGVAEFACRRGADEAGRPDFRHPRHLQRWRGRSLSATPAKEWRTGCVPSSPQKALCQRGGWLTSSPTAVAPAPESEAATQPLDRTDAVDQEAAELVAQSRLDPLMQGDSPAPLPLPPPHVFPPYTRWAWMVWPMGLQAQVGTRVDRGV
ncbi:hypothetical protein ACSSS7_006111 [Eimeria intestinalis]